MTGLWNAFAANTKDNPAAPALIFGDAVCSFAELRTLAERCAAALAGRGVGKGDVVALQLPKRHIAYALLLACLRLGAPYVFLDPKNPPERRAGTVARLRPKILFSEIDTVNPFGETLILAAADGEGWLAGLEPIADDAACPIVTGTDPAYIMFTSGSTGEPKGAVIPHQGVLSLMAWARNMLGDPTRERFTGINPLHFDNSVFDIYCGLLNGAALVPIETSEITNPASWVKTIRAAGASVMFAVPTLFLILDELGLLTPKALPGIRTFQFGGEGYPIGKLREFHNQFAGSARLVNVYGPTETSCICSSLEITSEILAGPDNEFPPLGKMHPDFSYAVLDDRLTPVPQGHAGELWIGGACVGLGYFANPVETAARFRQDPRQDKDRAIYYRSGDRVREDERGVLWFQGRVDNQVKIRGHRIELEEIDLAVQSIPDVQRAVAVVLAGPDGEEIAVAYLASRAVMAEEVRVVCKQRLPAYMRPAQVVQFDELPRNANGKVDRKAAKALLEQADQGMKLSIVTTLYKSCPYVEEFHRRASEAARRVTDDYEIVMVDDGSPDNSLEIACSIAARDSHVCVVELSRNFGHHKALMAGLEQARGDLCFLIDGDLEEDPALLGGFLDKMQSADCDVVYGFQERRKGDKLESTGGRIAWYWIKKLYSIDIPLNQCTVRLMRREYVDALLRHRESNTVIGGLWVITGFRQTGVPIAKGHRPESSYSPLLRFVTLLNGITSFSTVPLNLMVLVGMTVSFVSFAFGIFVILQKLIYNSAAGWASLIVSIWLMGGMIVFCLGVIGIYISRIFVETKNRPYVIVRRIHQRAAP